MYHKRKIIIGAIIAYLLLLISFFVLRNVEESSNSCGFTNVCIRFCCKNIESCNETFINKNFNESHWRTQDDDFKSKELKIYLGEPKCRLTLIDVGLMNSKFSTVSGESFWCSIYIEFVAMQGGILVVNEDVIYESDEYCLEDARVDSGVDWNLRACLGSHHPIQRILHLIR